MSPVQFFSQIIKLRRFLLRKNPDCSLQKLLLPLHDQVGMNLKQTVQFGNRFFSFQCFLSIGNLGNIGHRISLKMIMTTVPTASNRSCLLNKNIGYAPIIPSTTFGYTFHYLTNSLLIFYAYRFLLRTLSALFFILLIIDFLVCFLLVSQNPFFS